MRWSPTLGVVPGWEQTVVQHYQLLNSRFPEFLQQHGTTKTPSRNPKASTRLCSRQEAHLNMTDYFDTMSHGSIEPIKKRSVWLLIDSRIRFQLRKWS